MVLSTFPREAATTGEFLAAEAIVEMPRGSRNKYEFDSKLESIRLDRALFSSVQCPGDYGFIIATKCSDGDPLDVLILVAEPIFPGCRVRVRPIGVLFMDARAVDDALEGRSPCVLQSPGWAKKRATKQEGL